MATGSVNLSAQFPHVLYGTVYRYMCERELWEGPVEIQDAEVEISGLKYDLTLTGPVSFKQLKVQVEATSFDPATFKLDWRVVVDWKWWPATMVEQFTAELYGEVVWTTNQDSRLIRGAGACLSPSGVSCAGVKTTLTWPAGWTYGGSALRGIEVESQSTQGIRPTQISADLGEVVKAGGAKIAWECGLEDGNTPAPGLACSYSSLSIVGEPREVFRTWVGPFRHASNPPVAVGFSTPFYPPAASRCALRSFTAASGGPGGLTDTFWLGAHSVDCGWSPGNVYRGAGLHGFKSEPTPGSESVEFSLDATRLP